MVLPTASRPAQWSVVLALVAGFGAARAGAQTLFQWPDTTVNLTRYTSTEQCQAAVDRMRWRIMEDEMLWSDTMPPSGPRHRLAPAPPVITAVAARCAARFSVATADLEDYAGLLQLLLEADRDTDAAALVRRRVAAATTASARGAVIDTAEMAYFNAQPIRLKAWEELLQGGLQAPVQRLTAYSFFLHFAWNIDDTALTQATAQQMFSLYAALTPAQREELHTRLGVVTATAALVTHGRAAILDSLRQSTTAYAGLVRGALPDSPVGEHAPNVAADFWFPAESAGPSRPVVGRVTLIVFLGPLFNYSLDPATRQQYGDVSTLRTEFAVLRRLAQRFPDLQVILVGQTSGYGLYTVMTRPAAEAEWFHKGVESENPPPGALLAMSSTPFWRLPAPDGRRVNQVVANDTSFAFGGLKVGVDNPSAFLVDQDGLLVAGGPNTLFDFFPAPLDLMIDALLRRQGARGTPTPGAPPRPNRD